MSDYIGRRPVFFIGAIAQIVLAFPCFMLITSSGTWRPLVGCVVLGLTLACFAAPSVSTFGGTTPLATTALIKMTGSNLVPAFYLVVSGIIGLVAVYFLRESATQPLWGSPPIVADDLEADRLVKYAEGLNKKT
ncbi:hypothetical protein CLV47_101304 [Antricoccus suffuscus]|uniref:MFS transporter n=1 Tax=Antricoccus suffuscus TaxID=1629062 RepID=A0A2T1A6F6_9ACTN|nr:hypothetical protein [Antricoccus suffuscus]PRZ44179.1 hypothetical protein CLV47_101304 [Antricoccus suffuscus]